MTQPLLVFDFRWEKEKYHPEGHVLIKNVGTQPLLLLDIKLSCSVDSIRLAHRFKLWDEHILSPGESLTPTFSFMHEFDKATYRIRPISAGYGLEVVASDLSKETVLRYYSIPVLNVCYCTKGMPFSVRAKYFIKPWKQRYHRLRHRLKTR